MAGQDSSSLPEVFTVKKKQQKKKQLQDSTKKVRLVFLLPTVLHIWMSHSREMRQSASWCNMAFAGVLVAQEPDSGDSSPIRRGDARHRSGVCQ